MENDNVKFKNNKTVAVILVNYKDYAEKYFTECWDSLQRQDYTGEMKIFITDNESTEKSYEYIKDVMENIIPPLYLPLIKGENNAQGMQYEIIRNKNNDGFAKGNNDAMKKAIEQGFEYIILFNMDTVVEKDCVRKMVEVADNPPNPLYQGGKESGEHIGAVQARLMLWPERNKINSLGNVTHFLGFGYASGYGEKYTPPLNLPLIKGENKNEGGAEICYPSGAAVLYKAEALKKAGLFDEELWMYNEDQDSGWRLWLAGYKCVLAPEAVVCHKYEFSRSIKKYYWLDRNRIIVMLKNYRLATLMLVLPAFLIMEIGLMFFSIRGGWFKEKIKVYEYFLNLKNWRYILKARGESQKLRQKPDREIVKSFSGKIWYQEIGSGRLKVANLFFNIYWKIIRLFIFW